MRAQVPAAIRSIFNAPDQDEVERSLGQFIDRDDKTVPKLTDGAEKVLPEGFTVSTVPRSHRQRLRIPNLFKRLNEEIRPRTRVAKLFPDHACCLRLVTASLMQNAEEWQSPAQRYLKFYDLKGDQRIAEFFISLIRRSFFATQTPDLRFTHE